METPGPQLAGGPPEEPRGPDHGPLVRRLFVGLLLSSGAAIAVWLIAPRLRLALPWYVPLLAFAVILVAAVLPVLGKRTGEGDSGGQP